MKSLSALLLGLSMWAPASGAASFEYQCELARGSTARFDVQGMTVLFPTESSSRITVTIYQTQSDGTVTALSEPPAIYGHSANIHVGRFAGYMKFTPSILHPNPQVYSEKFAEIALKRSDDLKTMQVAFSKSWNARYNCRAQ